MFTVFARSAPKLMAQFLLAVAQRGGLRIATYAVGTQACVTYLIGTGQQARGQKRLALIGATNAGKVEGLVPREGRD